MRHSHTSRGFAASAKALLAVVALGFAAACADSVVAPTSEVAAKAPAAFDKVLGVQLFKYNPAQGLTQKVGNHVLTIPAGGVCDPMTSSYGPGTWDKPCKPLTRPIIIKATQFADKDGHPYVDFQPHLRFVPTKEVYLYLRDRKASAAADATVLWCNDLLKCVDESDDQSMKTRRNRDSENVFRRIKHFSGYVILARECPEGEECAAEDENNTSGSNRSGYMVASGITKKPGSVKGGSKVSGKKGFEQ